MRRTRLFAHSAVVALAATLMLGPTAGRALPSTAHVVAGSGIAGAFTVAGLTASETTQHGHATINASSVTFNCVFVMVSGPELHLAWLRGVDTSGVVWFVTIRQPTPATGSLLVDNTPDSAPCGAGQHAGIGSGPFTITP